MSYLPGSWFCLLCGWSRSWILYWILQFSYCIFNSRISDFCLFVCLYLFLVVSVSLSNFSFCSSVVFLILFSCLCVLETRWTSLKVLFWILCLTVHRSLVFSRSVIGTLLVSCSSVIFTWFFFFLLSLIPCVGTCTFVKVGSSSRLHRLTLAETDLY